MQQASTLSLAMSSMVWKYLIRWRRFRQVTRCLASNFRDLYTDGSDVLLQSLCMQRVDWHWCAPRVMTGLSCAGASDRPQKEIKISKVTIHANPLAD